MTPRFHRNAVRFAACIYEETEGDIRNALGCRGESVVIISGAAPLCERAMIVLDGEVNYVVFRGTKNKKQWCSNLNAFKRRLNLGLYRGKVHQGFWNGLTTLLAELKEHLNGHAGNKELVVTGHSRGAAMAILFAIVARICGYRIVEIHLFGCPRALTEWLSGLFGFWFPDRVWNWIANNDAVHRVPFKWMGFRHVGTRMYFDSSDRLKIDPDWKLKLKGQFLGRLKGGLLDGVRDHNAVKEYERLIGNLEFMDEC